MHSVGAEQQVGNQQESSTDSLHGPTFFGILLTQTNDQLWEADQGEKNEALQSVREKRQAQTGATGNSTFQNGIRQQSYWAHYSLCICYEPAQ